MKNEKVLLLTQAAAIAAIYVVLTVVFEPLSFGVAQVRIAEALTILPYFTPAAVPGLFIGCVIANFMGGGILMDVIFGSLATLAGALGSYALRGHKYLVPAPPIIANAVIVPFVLFYGYGINYMPIPLMMLSVGAGEVISCGIMGLVVLFALEKYRKVIFSAA